MKRKRMGEIPFLRKNDTFKTTVYRNLSNNGRYLN